MKNLSNGARQLPTHHITIRVPWHDDNWSGKVCRNPLANSSCLVLPRISENKQDSVEVKCASKRFDEIASDKQPPCVNERASFMAPFETTRMLHHPYAQSNPDTHGHVAPTRFVQPAYSAACVPYRWMLREWVEGDAENGTQGIAEQLQLGWIPDREPSMSFDTSWVQERDNQLALLDTFFSALRTDDSLCFFYAKRTPLSEQSRRVIVGVGRVLSIGPATEYSYKTSNPSLRYALWERNLGHSIRSKFVDGFLFPYGEILDLAKESGIDPEPYVAFAPEEQRKAYSYGSELLSHDGAVASLIACATTLNHIRELVEGPWDQVLRWIDSEINRIWNARGAFPGIGSALSAFGFEWGFQHGSLLAYEIELECERQGISNPWSLVEDIMKNPSDFRGDTSKFISKSLCKGWDMLSSERRILLELLSRCSISEEQALRFYDTSKRSDAKIDVTDKQLLSNPYLLFETDRHNLDPISFGITDRGMFPDEVIREEFPIPEPSQIDDPADHRRVRALVADILEDEASNGHSVLPRTWVIRHARERVLRPPCPLGENVLDVSEQVFPPIIKQTQIKTGEVAYQIDRLAECREIIRREVNGRMHGKPHIAEHDWQEIVNVGLNAPLPEENHARRQQLKARKEKAAALNQVFRARLSVLIGSAGTGKTTLLRMLCSIPDVVNQGVLLLAPTGKARVRLEEQTKQRGSGKTIAQFLSNWDRYDGSTGAYLVSRSSRRCGDFRTVIVDECSMLTEEQLAALFDSLTNVQRFVLVGDPRQLPPIGAGRPFVDIVNRVAPTDIETAFPRCASGYAELTIPQRQTTTGDDVLLANQFSGKPLDPGADEVWDIARRSVKGRLKIVEWSDAASLKDKLTDELVTALKLAGNDDELGFELSLGGTSLGDLNRAFFWNKFGQNLGAARKVANWQILSPLRSGLEGVDAINREVQERFRSGWKEVAIREGWQRKVPKPFGAQGLLYGDKVINVINQKRDDVYPSVDGEAYIANGDLGIVVGQYKTKKLRALPWKLEVEFAGQLSHKYGFSITEFADEGTNPLELAYALTVHKTQGSEFRLTFLVLPNPCWLLSRELIYTALTRHTDQLVVLHQGSFTDLRHYTGEQYSVISQRMTNLFSDPKPLEIEVDRKKRFLEAGLIHRTERGELVRSKSELIIADKLSSRGIEYAYEQPLVLNNGQVRYPDFTISDHARGTDFYWEHLGLLSDPNYKKRWERKKGEYLNQGILPYEEGGGSEGTLIETQDETSGALDACRIGQIIDTVILA